MNKQEVKKFADLARIETTDVELTKLASEIEDILHYVGQIKTAIADTADTHVESASVRNVFRTDDQPHPRRAHTEDVVRSAPDTEGQYVRVKKIL